LYRLLLYRLQVLSPLVFQALLGGGALALSTLLPLLLLLGRVGGCDCFRTVDGPGLLLHCCCGCCCCGAHLLGTLLLLLHSAGHLSNVTTSSSSDGCIWKGGSSR
jgi:hypothetical protein